MFENLDFSTVLPAVLLVGIFGIVAVLCFSAFHGSKKREEELIEQWEKGNFSELPVSEIGARIVSKRVDINYYRSVKTPEHRLVFLITFLTDDGNTLELEVPKELYEAYNEFEIGTLFIRENQFVDFGEKIEDKNA